MARPVAVPEDEAPPLSDALPNAPHPSDAPRVVGHAAAKAALADAMGSGRMHHAWLLSGPRGIGKATLAWRTAAALRAEAPEPDLPDDHPVLRRTRSGGEPGILPIRRSWNPDTKKLRQQIGVDDVRALGPFFGQRLMGGGRRVVIVDAADEMTPQAQNALLKSLEEPPEGAVLLLVCHRPSAILPTIRSRVRALKMNPLTAEETAEAMDLAGLGADRTLAVLSQGSPGEAARLAEADGAKLYATLVKLLSTAPDMDRGAALALSNTLSQRDAARTEAVFALLLTLLARLARAPLADQPEAVPGEASILARLSPDQAAARGWAGLHADLSTRISHALAVNLDPGALLSDTLAAVDRTAARLAKAR